jgi:outer membrane protein OmpA-like peptidoglycan-associated protein
VTEHAVLPVAGGATGNGTPDQDDDLASLRTILIGPAEQKLQAIEARLEDRFEQARDVSAVLPQALLHRARDPELARALAPPVETALTASVRRDPKPLADALFPVIGPAIRKAVAAALASMVESLNRTVEHSVSWRALRWRAEAWRSGKPFGEIVLAHTLLYRVEQVFLIHRKTGLLLQHVRGGAAHVEDAQLVSAMLTAIRDFVQDSFRTSTDDSLDSLKVGELSVWIEQGPAAILAAVVRGTAPPEYRQVLQRALEAIHLQFGEVLDAFEGDAAPFDAARPLLEDCVETQLRADRPRSRRGALVLLVLVWIALGAWAVTSYRDQRRFTAYVEALQREPGLVLVSADRRAGRYVVNGLRDPLARDPSELLRGSQVNPSRVDASWQPYQSLLPGFVVSRARTVLQPPPGVTLSFHDGILTAAGDASAGWIADARRLAPLIAGVTRFDAAGAIDARLRTVAARLQQATVLFVRGTTRLVPNQDAQLRAIADDVRELAAAAVLSGTRVQVDVTGHTDSDGGAESNVPLSRQRAQAVVSLLPQQTGGLDLTTSGVGSDAPIAPGQAEADKERNRCVTFRVLLTGPAR